jgi:hypothetical protein
MLSIRRFDRSTTAVANPVVLIHTTGKTEVVWSAGETAVTEPQLPAAATAIMDHRLPPLRAETYRH